MARMNIVMPQMGESITNGTITKWHKAEGDIVELDEILLEISTDKVESEIPSPVKGRIEVLHYQEGDTVDVGIVIAEVEKDLSTSFSGGDSDSSKSSKVGQKDKVEAEQVPTQQRSEGEKKSSESHRAGPGPNFYTPLVKSMAREHNVDLEQLDSIEGSGVNGRVTAKDFEKWLNSGGQQKAHQGRPTQERTSSEAAATSSANQNQGGYSGRVEVIPMDNMRKAIARNMVASKQTSPHVNSISEVDLTHLVKFRESFKAEFQKQEGIKLTYAPFVAWAIIQALKEFPRINASVDGDNLVVKKDINLGVAVAVPGNGLMVPVIHNADTLNITGLCRSINQLADKARNKKLTMDLLEGGTFTYTNVGSFGTLLATPIILQPQIGIYASGAIKKRAMVMDEDAIAVRHMMYGTHSYDHRVVDGEAGGLFLEAIHRNLKEMDPKALF